MNKSEMNRRILQLTIPIAIQNLLSAAVGSVDVIMLNYVGQSAISAVSLAVQYTNILFCVFYGLGTGASMLCAQYYGKGDMSAIKVIEGIALRFSICITALFSLLVVIIPAPLMHIFTNDAELISLGASYLRIMAIAYMCWSISEIYISILRSVGKVKLCMALSILAFACNIALNAIFIFGLFGCPKLGIVGVALATALSRLIQLLACFVASVVGVEVKLNPMYMFISNKMLVSDFLKVSLPALGNDIVWGAAFSMYSVILGHLGSDVVAANSIGTVVRNFGTTFCFGVASGGSILLGNLIGDNQFHEAEDCAKQTVKLTMYSGLLGTVIILAVTPLVLQFADISETALGYLKIMMLINSYYILGAALNTTLIVGVFRAGGDSRFGLICDAIDMWVYAVPLGFLAAFVFKLPVMWVYFLLCTDEFVKWPWVIKRYRSKKWLNNITRDHVADEA